MFGKLSSESHYIGLSILADLFCIFESHNIRDQIILIPKREETHRFAPIGLSVLINLL